MTRHFLAALLLTTALSQSARADTDSAPIQVDPVPTSRLVGQYAGQEGNIVIGYADDHVVIAVPGAKAQADRPDVPMVWDGNALGGFKDLLAEKQVPLMNPDVGRRIYNYIQIQFANEVGKKGLGDAKLPAPLSPLPAKPTPEQTAQHKAQRAEQTQQILAYLNDPANRPRIEAYEQKYLQTGAPASHSWGPSDLGKVAWYGLPAPGYRSAADVKKVAEKWLALDWKADKNQEVGHAAGRDAEGIKWIQNNRCNLFVQYLAPAAFNLVKGEKGIKADVDATNIGAALASRVQKEQAGKHADTVKQINDLQDAKGVRIHFDQRILAEVLDKGAAADRARLLATLSTDLSAAKDDAERGKVIAAFENDVKKRFLDMREMRTLDGLAVVSLKSLVAQAEKFKADWSHLPDELRNPGRIARIHGFAIAGDDILILGRPDPSSEPLEIDDLIVGLRAVWKENETPLVSLDPDPANIEGDPRVRIQGLPADSAFALTMLDADYAMKKIMAGIEPVDVPGYRTLKDTLSQTSRTFMSRFWLYPVQPRVGDIRVSADGSSALFLGAVQVLSEEMLQLKEGLVGTGQTFGPAEEAANSFSNCYAEIAAQKPVFKRLESLFDIVLLARVWHVRHLESPLLDRLCALPHRAVEIPKTYQAIRVFIRKVGEADYYLMGGVQAKMGAGKRSWIDSSDEPLADLGRRCQKISSEGAVTGAVAGALGDLSLQAIAPTARPDASSRYFSSAATHLLHGEFKEALEAADQLVACDSSDAEALILRALIHLRQADYPKARADAQQARAIDPSDHQSACAASEILFHCAWLCGDPQLALKEMEESLKNGPTGAAAQIARGEAMLLLDKPDEAGKAFHAALELDPACAMACARLSDLALIQGRLLDAKPWVKKALALDPALPEVRLASARWEQATVRPDLAEQIAKEVWDKEASGPTARLQALAILAAISASREKWNDVDKYINQMSQLSANSPEVLVAAAEIAIQWAERPRAMAYLARAENLSPAHPLVVKLRARLMR